MDGCRTFFFQSSIRVTEGQGWDIRSKKSLLTCALSMVCAQLLKPLN